MKVETYVIQDTTLSEDGSSFKNFDGYIDYLNEHVDIIKKHTHFKSPIFGNLSIGIKMSRSPFTSRGRLCIEVVMVDNETNPEDKWYNEFKNDSTLLSFLVENITDCINDLNSSLTIQHPKDTRLAFLNGELYMKIEPFYSEMPEWVKLQADTYVNENDLIDNLDVH